MPTNKKGFAPFIVIIVIAIAAVTIFSGKFQKNPLKVQGLEIAKGGDDSSGEKSGGSGGESSGGSRGSNSTSGSSKNESTPNPNKTPESRNETAKPTRALTPATKEPETEIEKEAENEIDENEFKLSDDGLELESSSVSAISKFPISFDKSTKSLTVNTGNGTKQIRILPDEAASIATTSGIENEIEKIELVQGTNQNAEFKIAGVRKGKLFGIFNINEPIETQIDASSGHIISTTTPSFIFQLLSAFIK